MKLNLGCGNKKLEGYINIDFDALCEPDLVLRLGQDVLPLSDDSVDEVLAYHVLEHIDKEFFVFLKDLYRVCRNGAMIKVKVPHPRHDYFLGDLTHVRSITIENMRPLSKEWCKTQSYINSSWSGLAYQLDVDFYIVSYDYILDDTFRQIISNIDDSNQVDWMARTMNNTISEIHFDMRVIK